MLTMSRSCDSVTTTFRAATVRERLDRLLTRAARPRWGAGLLLAAAVLLMHAAPVLAVPVFAKKLPIVIDETQPVAPANTMDVYVWGDEFHRIMEDANGYALIRDSGTSVICYAKLVLGVLQSTGTKVGTVDPSTIADAVKDLHLDIRGIFDAIPDIRSRRAAQVRRTPTATTGARRGLCIIIDFADKAGTISLAQVDNFCNQKAASGTPYTEFGNNGSVYDFFYDVSAGNLQLTNTVYGYYHSPNTRAYYDTSSKSDYGAQQLIMEALKGLGSTIDISKVDTEVRSDGFTYVKYLSVLYAGEMPADPNYPLWPHRWAISSASPAQDATFTASDTKTYYADLYQITNMADALAIGTFCHETAHLVCGFSDYYDTKMNSSGIGSWCLMGAGNWCGNGYDPAPPQPYLRWRAGWITPTAPTSSITALNCNMTDVIKFANPSNAKEYFLVSAIQNTGHFTSMPGAGIAIYHIDESKTTNNEYQHTASQHYEASLVQADGKYELETKEGSGGNRGNATDLFSSQNGVTTFSDTGSPVNAKWWDGSASGFSVTGVGASGGSSISVQFAAGDAPQFTSGPTATPNPATVGADITFSAAASDPKGLAVTIAWDFMDGTTGTGESLVHSYAVGGTYSVRVTATNSSQVSASTALPVTVSLKEASMSKGKFQLNFKTRRDNLDITLFSADFIYADKTTFETATNGTAVPVYIGTTLVDTITLYKGKGKAIGSMQWRYKQGYIRYTARNAALQDLLSIYGAANDDIYGTSVTLPFQIVINGVGYGGNYTFSYKAAKAKNGKGQVSW